MVPVIQQLQDTMCKTGQFWLILKLKRIVSVLKLWHTIYIYTVVQVPKENNK